MKYATHRARSRTAYHAFVCRPGDRIDADSVNRSVRHAERPDIRACLEGSRGGSSHVFDPDSSRAPELRRQSAPHLRIAVPAIIAHTLVAPALPRFLEQHREMRVQLLIAEGRGKPDRCDAAICIRPLDLEPQWSARCLAVMPEVLCASEVFLAVHGTPHGPHIASVCWIKTRIQASGRFTKVRPASWSCLQRRSCSATRKARSRPRCAAADSFSCRSSQSNPRSRQDCCTHYCRIGMRRAAPYG